MSRARSESSLSGPDRPVVVHCKEQTDGLLGGSVRDVYLWVDVTGVKFIEGSSRRVQWFTPFNEITMWAVDTDFFQLRVLDRKGRVRERTFLCGSQRAGTLKTALEETVKLYLHQADLVAELQSVAADFPVGSTVPKAELESVERFGTGGFSDPSLANARIASPAAVAGSNSKTPSRRATTTTTEPTVRLQYNSSNPADQGRNHPDVHNLRSRSIWHNLLPDRHFSPACNYSFRLPREAPASTHPVRTQIPLGTTHPLEDAPPHSLVDILPLPLK